MANVSALAAARKEIGGGRCRCAQCGYGICGGEKAALILATGDTVHRECWEEYAGDNAEEFLEDIVL